MKNFTNGAMVFRVWPDGSGEVMAKFQYKSHAELFAKAIAEKDTCERNDCEHFYLAVFVSGADGKRLTYKALIA